MKKTLVSLAAASLIVTSAMAADKGIDIVTTGQAVVYYQTMDRSGDGSLFNQDDSVANFAVQLNGNADLGNGFALGAQLSYLGTAGLETSLVSGVAQPNNGTDALAVTKMNIAKKIGNTTVKLGRQELPKSLSPLAFSEGWNVFKNTFDAVLVVNSDIPGVTLVGAAVGTSNSSKDIGTWDSLKTSTTATTADGAYMITAQTSLIPMTTLTASYYILGDLAATPNEGANALWIDAKIASKDLPLGLKIGLQGGQISPEADLDATTAIGAKVSLSPIDNLGLTVAYSSVDDGVVGVTNTGTGVKTPLYTQLILNQNYIRNDNDTIMVQGAYSLGSAGKVIARVAQTTDNSAAEVDFTDIELIYKTKIGGVNILAAYLNLTAGDDDANNVIRIVARKAF